MNAFLVLFRKQLGESKWFLGLSSLALFGLSWLTVFITARIEARIRAATGGNPGGMRMLRGLGGSAMDFSSPAIEVAWWNHPFILLVVLTWAISRGSGSVAAEIERGTLDLTMSRPVSRFAYLAMQVSVAAFGLVLMMVALIMGNLVGSQYNKVESPPTVVALLRPAANLAALGFAIYGITLIVSSRDVVRWRSTLFGSVVTLGSFILLALANAPGLEDYKWMEQFSLFKAYNPVEAVVKGENLAFNAGVLCALGAFGVALGYGLFQGRDLPANS